MGLLSFLFPSKRQLDVMRTGVILPTFDWDVSDPLDMVNGPMTREAALEIPGVARAHHTLVGKLAQMELVADNGSGIQATPQPTFLYRGDVGEAPEMRMWCTADDLYFHGSALWVMERGAARQPLSVRWMPYYRWEADVATGAVTIDGQPVRADQYVLFQIPMWSGILGMAQRTLYGARDIERAWTARMRSPVNLIDLHVTDDSQLEQEEVDAYVKAWASKHHSGAPAVGMTPPGIELRVNKGSLGPAELFLQARDAVRTDIGSHSSLDGGMVDSSGGASSLTYETHEGQRGDFYEFDLPFWTVPITARLSMNDIVPNGTRVLMRFRPVIAPDDQNLSPTGREISTSTSSTAPASPTAPAAPGGGTNGDQ